MNEMNWIQKKKWHETTKIRELPWREMTWMKLQHETKWKETERNDMKPLNEHQNEGMDAGMSDWLKSKLLLHWSETVCFSPFFRLIVLSQHSRGHVLPGTAVRSTFLSKTELSQEFRAFFPAAFPDPSGTAEPPTLPWPHLERYIVLQTQFGIGFYTIDVGVLSLPMEVPKHSSCADFCGQHDKHECKNFCHLLFFPACLSLCKECIAHERRRGSLCVASS